MRRAGWPAHGPEGEIRLAVSSASRVGESPMWHPREQVLYWCDIAGRRLNRFDPRSEALVHWDFEQEVSCCAPRLEGGLLLAMRDGLWHFEMPGATLTRLAEPPYEPERERFNDGKADPQGRFWIGTLYEPREPASAALYCYTDHELERRAEGITNSNGLAWSPNGRTMYWADTTAHTVFAFDFDPSTGELSGRRVFHRFAARPAGPLTGEYGGRPDGAAVDSEGCYWVAMFEGQRIARLAPDGSVLGELRLPVCCPTMVCFGGPDLRTLYISTARENRSPEELANQPWAGCVLSTRVAVPGLPANFVS